MRSSLATDASARILSPPIVLAQADSTATVETPEPYFGYESSRLKRYRRDARWAERLRDAFPEGEASESQSDVHRKLHHRWRAGPRGSYRSNFEPADPFITDDMLREMKEGILSSFHTPIEDLFKRNHPTDTDSLLKGLSVSFRTNLPLDLTVTSTESEGVGSQGTRSGNTPTLNASFKYNPISYWFFATTFAFYLDPELQAPWNGDFTYVFGYDDWHPYTLSFLYSNYGGNRLNPDRSKGERFTRFEQGSFSLNWKFPLPPTLNRVFSFTRDGTIGCSIGADVTPRYGDLASASIKRYKTVLALSCKYNIYKWWYFNWSAKYYPFPQQQQPWDPDYTYGFGYFDWHRGTITVQYNNFSGNRYPWRNSSPGTGRFKNGTLSVGWSWSFD
ncbi:MAG: hypothetical protein AAF493_14570 [Pseudomonadota bacterium]